MGIRDWLTGRTIEKIAAQEERVMADLTPSDTQAPADRRVYNEYFIEHHADDDHYHWLCRVYGPDGMRAEKRGLHLTEDGARLQAMTYANKTKSDIRAAL